MEAFWQDVRYAWRMLAKMPGFTAIAVLTLALGIGLNTAVFSVADGLLWKTVPFPELDRLVMVLELRPNQQRDWNSVSPANYFDWKEQSRSFAEMAVMTSYRFNLTGAGDPENVIGSPVSANFFSVLRVKPLLGRTFLPEEEQTGRDQVVVLSYGLWQRRFAPDPKILSRAVKLEGSDYTVVGVMGREFDFLRPSELWLPLAFAPTARQVRGNHYLEVLARLKPEVSLSEAQAEMRMIAQRLDESYPDTNRGWRVRVMPIRDFVANDLVRGYSYLLMGAVGFVLLIACANVAGLQFARAAGRRKEVAVRTALGATRLRLMRQWITESVLAGLLGAAAGLLLALWAIEVILLYMPPDVEKFINGWNQIQLDLRAFSFTLAIAILSGILAGIMPALQGTKTDVNEELKEGSRGGTASRARHRLRGVLVVGEVTLALILLAGAGLMLKGFSAMIDLNQNFDPSTILTLRVDLLDSKYGNDVSRRAAFFDQALSRLKTLPGITAAAIATSVPYGRFQTMNTFAIEGHTALRTGEFELAMNQYVNPDFFAMFHIPLIEGRLFDERDSANAPRVAIISERLAKRQFPGQSAIGRRIKIGLPNSPVPWLTIVGVVGDIRYDPWEKEIYSVLYRPFWQAPREHSYFAIRTSGDPLAFVPAVRAQLAALDAEQPLYEIKTHAHVARDQIVALAYVAVMFAVLGAVALVLSSVGVYGVMAHSVTERTHEIGIRMALGARPVDVLRLVGKQGLWLAGLGLALGLAGAVALARLLAWLVFGISETDWATFVGVSFVLAAAAIVACLLPARRATRVDPMVALRYE